MSAPRKTRAVSAVPPPARAEWMATLRCGLRCRHCCAGAGRAADGELDTREGLRLLDELAALGVEQMCLSGGEFTMRPDWEELLERSLERFPQTLLITNGWLGRGLVERLERLGGGGELTLMVSVDGRREAHDARRGKGSFDRAVAVLRAPTRRQKAVMTAVDAANIGELRALERLCLALDVGEWCIQPCLPTGRMKPEGFIGASGLRALADSIAAARRRCEPRLRVYPPCWFGYSHPMREGRPWRGCPAGTEQLVVMPDGGIRVCGLVQRWNFGTVRGGGLRRAWRSAALRALRRERPSGCTGCARCARGCEAMQLLFGRQFCSL